MADYWIKAGDQLPFVSAVLRDGAGTPVNVSGSEVTFVMRTIRTGETVLQGTAVVDDDGDLPTRGQVHYEWDVGETDEPGGYLAEWRVVYIWGTEQETFPDDSHITIAILPNLGELAS